MHLKPLFFIVVIIPFSCKKETIDTQLIIGHWQGSSTINTTTIIDKLTTNPPIIKSDTVFCSPGLTFINLDIFAGDTLNVYSMYKQNTPDERILFLGRDYYTIKNNMLYCNENPFSFNGYSAIITTLTANSMTLYDKDTTNYQPLVINELWTNFYK